LISREKRKKNEEERQERALIPDLFFFQFFLSFSFLPFSALAPVGCGDLFFFSVFTIIMGFAEQPAEVRIL